MNLYLQSPVDSNDESDVISGQTHRGQHDHHGNKTSLWDSSCTDAGGRGSDAERTERESRVRLSSKDIQEHVLIYDLPEMKVQICLWALKPQGWKNKANIGTVENYNSELL